MRAGEDDDAGRRRSTASGCTTPDTGDPDGAAGGLRQLARHRPPGLGRAPAATCPPACASSATTCAATASATRRRATTSWATSSPTPPALMRPLGVGDARLRRPLDRRRRRAGPRRRAARPRARRWSSPTPPPKIGTEAMLARPHRRGARRRHRRDRRRRSWSAGSPGASAPSAPTSSPLWRHMLTRTPVDGYVGCCAAIARHRPARVDRRPAPAGARRSPAPTTARPRPTSCARPPTASPARASRSSAAPATSPASRRRRRWRG